jgi:NADP-dependent 3-hydroxy acid dehydrogenase YdfG
MTQAVVVFGAYGGIGAQLCRRLSSHGAKLLMAGRDEVRLAALASEVGGETYTLDATDLHRVQLCVEPATELFSGITGVASCVGSLVLKPAHLLSEEDWDTTITSNLKSSLQYCTQQPKL